MDDIELTAAARDVLAERQRQVSDEGWTPEHDDEHCYGEMAQAAAAYAVQAASIQSHHAGVIVWFKSVSLKLWPWSYAWWKPGTARRMLVKAAALILAEIERLDRATAEEDRHG